MKRLLFFLQFFCICLLGYSQKLYGVVNLTAPFSGISYTNGHNREEFRPSIARINFSWGVDLIYRTKSVNHKLSVEQVPFEKYFKIINKFMLPPNNEHLLGNYQIKFSTAIDHFIFNYALQKEGKKEKGFLFHSQIRFNYSAGLGISLNRSKTFYKEVYPNSSDGRANSRTYMGYTAVHHRDGFGIFLRGTGGFDFINKNEKRKLSFNLFFNQGLKDMAHYDIHYQYGYWNDPSKQVDVPKQVLRSRGTTFGFSLGVPVTIKK
jgi:hypothetical protein